MRLSKWWSIPALVLFLSMLESRGGECEPLKIMYAEKEREEAPAAPSSLRIGKQSDVRSRAASTGMILFSSSFSSACSPHRYRGLEYYDGTSMLRYYDGYPVNHRRFLFPVNESSEAPAEKRGHRFSPYSGSTP